MTSTVTIPPHGSSASAPHGYISQHLGPAIKEWLERGGKKYAERETDPWLFTGLQQTREGNKVLALLNAAERHLRRFRLGIEPRRDHLVATLTRCMGILHILTEIDAHTLDASFDNIPEVRIPEHGSLIARVTDAVVEKAHECMCEKRSPCGPSAS